MLRSIRANSRNFWASEDGFTLLEAVIASMITAGTLVIALLFSMRAFEISAEVNRFNDINHAFRRTERTFTRDVRMAQYFYFGASIDNENNQILNQYIDRRVLTVGYPNDNDEMIWSRYAITIGSETGVYYLLRTSNELAGGTAYETLILATDVTDMYFTYYNQYDQETTAARDVRRIEMTITLSDDTVTEKNIFTSTLRGENLGVALPTKNLEVYQDTNFVK